MSNRIFEKNLFEPHNSVMKEQPTAYPLRMPSELRETLESIAKENGRSLNAEIITRLHSSLPVNQALLKPIGATSGEKIRESAEIIKQRMLSEIEARAMELAQLMLEEQKKGDETQ